MEDLNEIELQLWSYIDGFTEGEEKSRIEQLISEHAEWKAKYQELLGIHDSLQVMELEQPSMRFTKNVMEEIARVHIAPATRQYINKKIIWGIMAFFATVIIGFLGYGFSQVNWNSSESANSDLLDKVTNVDYSLMFNNQFINAFIMLNVILGLMLFDRYLTEKKKAAGMTME